MKPASNLDKLLVVTSHEVKISTVALTNGNRLFWKYELE